MRKTIAVAAAALALVGASACAEDNKPTAAQSSRVVQGTKPIAPIPGTPPVATAAGTFAPFKPGAVAVTYDDRNDNKTIPVGAQAKAQVTQTDKSSSVTLSVQGLLPNHPYGAHLHTKPCGSKIGDAGAHYQNLADPVQPSVDPKYANAQNEVWLDFTTDAKGIAQSAAKVEWPIRPGQANSIIIHALHTRTTPGKAGTAGMRLACLTIPL